MRDKHDYHAYQCLFWITSVIKSIIINMIAGTWTKVRRISVAKTTMQGGRGVLEIVGGKQPSAAKPFGIKVEL